jgi:AraC-like DNA-binding protein
MRLVRPFLRHISALASPHFARAPEGALRLAGCDFTALSSDARIPVRAALLWLEEVVAGTGDHALGLHAAQHFERGGYDLVEYAARSCGTWGEALEIVLRYVHLLNEAADYGLYVSQGTARLELRSKIPLPRAAADFTVCGLALAALRWTGAETLEGYELWFRHPAPQDQAAYNARFGLARLCFDAPVDALLFDASCLVAPLRTADPNLNALLRRHAEQSLGMVAERRSMAAQVRSLLTELLPAGISQGERVARRLGLSRRTLSRQLESEGTSYESVLEEVRYGLARQYLTRGDLNVQDVAFLLGYSETAAFSRAFKRWSGIGPTSFRNRCKGIESATLAAR